MAIVFWGLLVEKLLWSQIYYHFHQVSNWFINARVRLWKPMVEQMYVEESKELELANNEQGATSNAVTTANAVDMSYNTSATTAILSTTSSTPAPATSVVGPVTKDESGGIILSHGTSTTATTTTNSASSRQVSMALDHRDPNVGGIGFHEQHTNFHQPRRSLSSSDHDFGQNASGYNNSPLGGASTLTASRHIGRLSGSIGGSDHHNMYTSNTGGDVNQRHLGISGASGASPMSLYNNMEQLTPMQQQQRSAAMVSLHTLKEPHTESLHQLGTHHHHQQQQQQPQCYESIHNMGQLVHGSSSHADHQMNNMHHGLINTSSNFMKSGVSLTLELQNSSSHINFGNNNTTINTSTSNNSPDPSAYSNLQLQQPATPSYTNVYGRAPMRFS